MVFSSTMGSGTVTVVVCAVAVVMKSRFIDLRLSVRPFEITYGLSGAMPACRPFTNTEMLALLYAEKKRPGPIGPGLSVQNNLATQCE